LECGGLTPPSAHLLSSGPCAVPSAAAYSVGLHAKVVPRRRQAAALQGASRIFMVANRRIMQCSLIKQILETETGLFLGDITWRIIAGVRSKRGGQSATARY